MAETSDRDLVQQTRQGQVEAFGELVTRYQTAVFNVCLRMLGVREEAEDLAQETFIRAFQRLETFDLERPFVPWIRRIATNLCINHLQRKRPVRFTLDEERDQPALAHQETPEDRLEGKQAIKAMKIAIAELLPHYRAVIELRHYQDLSYAEIAEVLDLPISDVKSHLYRARKQLASRLANRD
jgi:RNA polymerase sigma-70 factor (ECF subfamily)